jgi:hypothetical protein
MSVCCACCGDRWWLVPRAAVNSGSRTHSASSSGHRCHATRTTTEPLASPTMPNACFLSSAHATLSHRRLLQSQMRHDFLLPHRQPNCLCVHPSPGQDSSKLNRTISTCAPPITPSCPCTSWRPGGMAIARTKSPVSGARVRGRGASHPVNDPDRRTTQCSTKGLAVSRGEVGRLSFDSQG